jgi:hypothetical protein
MYRLSKSDKALDRGTEDHGALAKGITSVAPAGLPTPVLLMGTGDQLSIPRLEGVPLEYCYSAGDSALIALARMLLELDLTAAEQWEPAHHDPGAYVLNALKCWIATHGGDSIRRRFDLYVTLTSYLDEYSEKNENNPDGTQLYLTVDPDRCGFVVLGPTLELLETAAIGLRSYIPRYWIRGWTTMASLAAVRRRHWTGRSPSSIRPSPSTP